MKNAFTMVELIFVIVIIGILASVAIPKLTATRDDAEDAKKKTNVARCLMDAVALYTARQIQPSNTVSEACQSGVSVIVSGDMVTVSHTLSDGSTFAIARYFKGTRVSY